MQTPLNAVTVGDFLTGGQPAGEPPSPHIIRLQKGWQPDTDLVRSVVESQTAEDLQQPNLEEIVTEHAKKSFSETYHSDRAQIEHMRVETEIELAEQNHKIKESEDELANTEQYDPEEKRLTAPHGWYLVIALCLFLILLALIGWTIFNTATMLRDSIQDLWKSALIVAPLALCPLLVELAIMRVPGRWQRAIHQLLAALSVGAFSIWAGSLAANYLQPVTMDDVLSGGIGPRFRGVQLGSQIALEITLGALIFASIVGTFHTKGRVTDEYATVLQKVEERKGRGNELKSKLDSLERLLLSFTPEMLKFASLCVQAAKIRREIFLEKQKSNLALEQLYERILAGQTE